MKTWNQKKAASQKVLLDMVKDKGHKLSILVAETPKHFDPEYAKKMGKLRVEIEQLNSTIAMIGEYMKEPTYPERNW